MPFWLLYKLHLFFHPNWASLQDDTLNIRRIYNNVLTLNYNSVPCLPESREAWSMNLKNINLALDADCIREISPYKNYYHDDYISTTCTLHTRFYDHVSDYVCLQHPDRGSYECKGSHIFETGRRGGAKVLEIGWSCGRSQRYRR